jgi:predicted nucleic acid-binding protein
VRRELADRFHGRLLMVDSGVAARWGAPVGAAEARGRSLPAIGSLMAATALQHGLTVVTRNADGLERCGVRCLNPWTGK